MQVQWHHPETFTEADRQTVEERIEALAGDHGDLIDVRISARTTEHHRHGAQEVRVVCAARGKEIVAARTRPDAALALQEAVDVFEREVWRMRHRRTQQRRERPAEPPELGVVDEIRREEGCGFVITDAGERVYFHRNAVGQGLAFDGLVDGQRVALNIEAGAKGLQATFIAAPPPDAPGP